jgi:large subunit ribosomal protein L4e
MAARPQVSVQSATDAKSKQLAMPAVFLAPIRPDIVQFVHTNMRKNARQAYAVKRRKNEAGHGHSAHSWGTGRAVSRIPRVSGGGTSRAGQGAFGNMCRSGRMFNPTRTWRKWHRKINTNQKRYAVASALAASALPSLVLARGHKISNVPEVPLVISNDNEDLKKTKQAIAALKAVGAYDDVEKAKASRKIRVGKGKMRNRRHVQRLGPLVVYKEDNGIVAAMRNLPGVELAHVERLNLLQLAPGGHMGRFIVWTQSAFEALNGIFGSETRESTQKTGYTLPRNVMANSDITRIINSDEVQSKVKAAITTIVKRRIKKNPLKNLGVKVRLNPYALSIRRSELLAQERQVANKAAKLKAARANRSGHTAQKANYARMIRDGKDWNAVEEEEPVAEEEEETADADEEPAAAAAPEPAAAAVADY